MMADPEMPSLIAGMLAESDSDPEMPGLTDSSSSSSESSDDGDASMMAQIARLSDLADGEEPVLPPGWRKNLIGAPLPPDATSYFQEPDTHEHSQLKAEYREAKANLHFALEQEYRNEHKNAAYVRGGLPRFSGSLARACAASRKRTLEYLSKVFSRTTCSR